MAMVFRSIGKIEVPLAAGQVPAVLDLTAQFEFTQRAEFQLEYDGAVVDDIVSLGTMVPDGGAKVFYVFCEEGGCTLRINDQPTAVPLNPPSVTPRLPGGFLLFVNPQGPGITALAVTTTGPAVLKVIALA